MIRTGKPLPAFVAAGEARREWASLLEAAEATPEGERFVLDGVTPAATTRT